MRWACGPTIVTFCGHPRPTGHMVANEPEVGQSGKTPNSDGEPPVHPGPAQDSVLTTPARMAQRTSPATSWMSSRCMISLRWVSTVLTVRWSCWAISLLEQPSATSCRISRWRGVRRSSTPGSPTRRRYSSTTCFETRSEEHTSELQSRLHLVCRLLLEKKKKRRERNRIKPSQESSITTSTYRWTQL